MSDDVTPEDVTPEVLDRLEALLAKSTPRPWKPWGDWIVGPGAGHDIVGIDTDDEGDPYLSWHDHERDLITEAVNALPALIAATRQVRAAEEAQLNAVRSGARAADRAERAEAALAEVDRILGPPDEFWRWDDRNLRISIRAALDAGRADQSPLAEQGRRLASQREDLIAQGVDPADLKVPLHPDQGGERA